MAYSDYGGYAYRNGKRVEERSDATISPEGDTFGSPGMWPGFAAHLAGGDEEVKRRENWPSGHAVLGDGPIYVVLYKQTGLYVYRGPVKLDELELLKDAPEEAITNWTDEEGNTHRWLETSYFQRTGKPLHLEVDGWKLEVFFLSEDNLYLYAKLTQPDGTLWHGWSGYGVGAGLEDGDHGFSTSEREAKMVSLWPESIQG